jgi:cytochrome c biogenesis protein CcdA/thiol-disulfide isomerase/thioredoxin
MIVLYGVAFLSGLFTILAPCIWPLLPIVLADVTQSKSKRRPLGITAGVAVSYAFFTLAISALESTLGLNPNVLRKFAVVVLLIIGILMIIPALSRRMEASISRLSGRFGGLGRNQRSDFGGGFITGVVLGIVWTPCSGPILASVAVLAGSNKVSLQTVIVTLFYVLGLSIPLFGFAVGGQRLLAKSRFMSKHTGRIQIVSGVVMIVTALAIYTNYDKTLEAKLLSVAPSYTNALTSIERTSSVTKALAKLKGSKLIPSNANTNNAGLFNENMTAPEIKGISKWLNGSGPETIASLKGKVVLVDFWTYSCINCLRTLPHIKAWYTKYHSSGFEVIGVHTPEFAFEKDAGNVNSAIKRYGIPYPVALDNNYTTWNAYNNQYWPAEYLIDATGKIRRTEFGEGNYGETEQAIRTLLAGAGHKVTIAPSDLPDTAPQTQVTPETYFGSNRSQYGYPAPNYPNGTFTIPQQKSVPLDQFAFGGTWTIAPEYAQASKGATLTEHFGASKVYMILKPLSAGPSEVAVTYNGKPLTGSLAGSDVVNGIIKVDSDRLYNIFDSGAISTNGTLQFTFLQNGVEAFTFTFG